MRASSPQATAALGDSRRGPDAAKLRVGPTVTHSPHYRRVTPQISRKGTIVLPDLRINAPRLEPDPVLLEQLSQLSSASAARSARRATQRVPCCRRPPSWSSPGSPGSPAPCRASPRRSTGSRRTSRPISRLRSTPSGEQPSSDGGRGPARAGDRAAGTGEAAPEQRQPHRPDQAAPEQRQPHRPDQAPPEQRQPHRPDQTPPEQRQPHRPDQAPPEQRQPHRPDQAPREQRQPRPARRRAPVRAAVRRQQANGHGRDGRRRRRRCEAR